MKEKVYDCRYKTMSNVIFLLFENGNVNKNVLYLILLITLSKRTWHKFKTHFFCIISSFRLDLDVFLCRNGYFFNDKFDIYDMNVV